MNSNTGHGHVRPRPDGMKARCGGPAICRKCAEEFAAAQIAKARVGSRDTEGEQ